VTDLIQSASGNAPSPDVATSAAARGDASAPILEAAHLRKLFPVHNLNPFKPKEAVHAVEDASLKLYPGRATALVGESGSGKTTVARMLAQLYTPTSGTILFEGQPVSAKSASALREYRRHVQLIFQDPFSSLNPRMTVLQIVAEPMRNCGVAAGAALEARVAELLRQVGLSPDMMRRYPHAFSGGQRQRIGIARAIALEPRLIVADEATSALDVSLRAQMLDLLLELRERLDLSYVFISHDISVVRYMCDRVAVMHRGRIVEIGETGQVCYDPQHPYTRSLISAVPRPDPRLRGRIARVRYEPA